MNHPLKPIKPVGKNMTPLLKTLIYKHKGENDTQEFMIKEKDYGELVLYDIFFKETFLITISQNGEVLLSNWECAKCEPVNLNENTLKQINTFIVSQRSH
jgi:hypothetical protein